MKLINLKIKSFKNLTGKDGWFEIDFENKNGITVLVGNNGSGKSNVLEVISAVFATIQTDLYALNFSFILKYSIENKLIEIRYLHDQKFNKKLKNGTEIFVDGVKHDILGFREFEGKTVTTPIKLIANYSGEESRLYKTYYKYFYDKFISDGIDNIYSNSNIIFTSKKHWEIALITLVISGYDLKDILGDRYISKIKIDYNNNIEKFFKLKPESVVNNFAKRLKDFNEEIRFNKFEDLVDATHEDLYKRLAISLLHKEEKNRLFNDIDVIFNDGTTSKELSEGEKKQILMFFIFEFLANKNSIILLDEPDSYIHVGNKERLKKIFEKFTKDDDGTRKGGEIILTTHSPTLMNSFGGKNLEFLENGEIKTKEKQEILDSITYNTMSFSDKLEILTTTKDILLVEGKTDEKYISKALKVLKEDNENYRDLDFEFIPTGGASGLKLFIDKFYVKNNQKIIGILDSDEAGDNSIENLTSSDEKKELEKDSYVKLYNKEVFLLRLPRLDRITDKQFEIEDYFPLDKLQNLAIKQIKNEKVLKNMSVTKKALKSKIEREYLNFDKEDFEGFKALFDKILEIKDKK